MLHEALLPSRRDRQQHPLTTLVLAARDPCGHRLGSRRPVAPSVVYRDRRRADPTLLADRPHEPSGIGTRVLVPGSATLTRAYRPSDRREHQRSDGLRTGLERRGSRTDELPAHRSDPESTLYPAVAGRPGRALVGIAWLGGQRSEAIVQSLSRLSQSVTIFGPLRQASLQVAGPEAQNGIGGFGVVPSHPLGGYLGRQVEGTRGELPRRVVQLPQCVFDLRARRRRLRRPSERLSESAEHRTSLVGEK